MKARSAVTAAAAAVLVLLALAPATTNALAIRLHALILTSPGECYGREHAARLRSCFCGTWEGRMATGLPPWVPAPPVRTHP
jgi:hypothetical protein